MAESEALINHFPEIIEALKEGAKVAIRQVARDLTDESSSVAPYDTGALAASHYYVASDVSTYGQAVSAAQSANEHAAMLPEVDHPESDTEAIIAAAADYALYVHDGTRHHGARPWMAQTVAGAEDKVLTTLAQVIGEAIKRAAL